jgi:hypothetical protein
VRHFHSPIKADGKHSGEVHEQRECTTHEHHDAIERGREGLDQVLRQGVEGW